MARPKKNKTVATNGLLEAIQFVGSILQEKGTPNETHILISNGWCVAFNGIVASGCKVSLSFFAAPNYYLLEKALSKCGEYEIETLPTSIVIKSGKFKAVIPCIDPVYINVSGIDENKIAINDEFKKGLEITGALANENGQTIHYASILINGQSLVSTENGVMLIEYWHGCDLPTNIAVPKALVAPLTKTNKKLIGFGYSETSVTFYFEDESWIKSQLFSEKWPNVERILNVQSNPVEAPKELWEALSVVAPHSTDNLVYFDNDLLASHSNINMGASYTVKGLQRGPIFNIKQLAFIKDYVKTIDFFAEGGKMTMWYGDKCRGVIAGRVQQ